MVIEGEPGIGKTRLADELRARALGQGALAVWGRADEGGATPALWPWLPPLPAVAARAEEVPAVLALVLFAEGRSRYTGIGGRSGVPTFEASLALNVARQGRMADAVAVMKSAREEFETFDERWNEPIVLIAEAVVAHAAGHPVAARNRLEQAVEVATQQGSHVLAPPGRARRRRAGSPPARLIGFWRAKRHNDCAVSHVRTVG